MNCLRRQGKLALEKGIRICVTLQHISTARAKRIRREEMENGFQPSEMYCNYRQIIDHTKNNIQ